MGTTKTTRNTLAALAVASISVGVLGASTAMAQAAPANAELGALPCTSDQFTTTLVGTGHAAGSRYGALQFTAKQGERCYLNGKPNVDLVGAHDVVVSSDAPAHVSPVLIFNGSSAYVPLHWGGVEAPSKQETPNAITYTAPAASNAHGDPIDPMVTRAWTLDPIDATKESHTLTVSAIRGGTAPISPQG